MYFRYLSVFQSAIVFLDSSACFSVFKMLHTLRPFGWGAKLSFYSGRFHPIALLWPCKLLIGCIAAICHLTILSRLPLAIFAIRPADEKSKQLRLFDFSTPVAQKAKLGFKLLLLERLNENLKQKHFQNPYKKSFNRGGDHIQNLFVLMLFLLFLFFMCVGFSTHVWEFPNR